MRYLIASMAALFVASMLFLSGCGPNLTTPTVNVIVNQPPSVAKAAVNAINRANAIDKTLFGADPTGQSTDPSANQGVNGTAGAAAIYIIVDQGGQRIGIPTGINANIPASSMAGGL